LTEKTSARPVAHDLLDSDSPETLALAQRLLAIAPYVAPELPATAIAEERGVGALFDAIARSVQAGRDVRHVWLTLIALTASFPNAENVRMAHRALRLAAPGRAMVALLESGFDDAARFGDLDREIDVVTGAVVVDVDFCANHLHNTGIQRVVRQTMARWNRDRPAQLVAWTAGGGAMRTLSDVELGRVVDWSAYSSAPVDTNPVDPPRYRLVVPFESVVLLPEVPQAALMNPLAALAEHSGNRVGLIGYDAIPVVSADLLPSLETERFVRYLTVVKHSHRIAGISRSATEEFAGFCATLPAQGLVGPETVQIGLPVDAPDHEPRHGDDAGVPSVLCVGSLEARKNQLAVLYAAEMLWREGLDFSLTFIGGGSLHYTRDFDKQLRRLRRAGRKVEILRGVNDAVLLRAYSSARFSVFPSLHEGYGLPVAESLAYDTPVITSNYGSTADIAAGGGCLVVDPRDDADIISTMRSLLTDDELLARLRREIGNREDEGWDDFARELWTGLVEPMLEASVVR